MDIMIVIIIMTGAQFHRLIDMPGTAYIYFGDGSGITRNLGYFGFWKFLR